MAYTQSAVSPIIYTHSKRTRYFVLGLLVLTCIVLLAANIAPPPILAEGNSNSVMAAACVTGAATFVPPGMKITPVTSVPCKTQSVASKTATPLNTLPKQPTITQTNAFRPNISASIAASQNCAFPNPVLPINYTFDFSGNATSTPAQSSAQSSLSSICMIGKAASTFNSTINKTVLRLTSAIPGQVGAAWYDAPINLGGGFTTSFDVILSPAFGQGYPQADGFAFVIQGASNVANAEIGTGGCDMGFAGIPDSAAVQFDTFGNNSTSTFCSSYNDPSNNYISLQSNGIMANSASHASTTGTPSTIGIPNSNLPFVLADGQAHHFIISYLPGQPDTATPTATLSTMTETPTLNPSTPTSTLNPFTAIPSPTMTNTPTPLPNCQSNVPGYLTICVDSNSTPLLHVKFNLANTLALTNGLALVGFTAGTGTYYQNHDIIDWQLTTNSYSATLTPSATPTNTLTPSITPTSTITPTATITPTPTLPTNGQLVVTNTNDSGPGSLRDAIDFANQTTNATITFASNLAGQTINVASGLTISQSMTIQGPLTNLITINAQNLQALIAPTFYMHSLAANVQVNFSGLVVKAGYRGFGFYPYDGASVTIDHCEIDDNSSYGIDAEGGGNMVVTNSTIARNGTGSGAYGVGIFANGRSVSISNSTISGNGNSSAYGGGIDIYGNGAVNVSNSTITGNTAARGGGIYDIAAGPLTLKSTILAGNIAPTAPDIAVNASSYPTSGGYNLIGDIGNAVFPAVPSDIIGLSSSPINALLDVLTNNGGPTRTIAIQVGSPAIQTGNCAGLITDQRGLLRNTPCDMGAYERSAIIATSTPSATSTSTSTLTSTLTSTASWTPTATSAYACGKNTATPNANFTPSNTPRTPKPTPTLCNTQTPTRTKTATLTATATYTASNTRTSTLTHTPKPPTPTKAPTPGPFGYDILTAPNGIVFDAIAPADFALGIPTQTDGKNTTAEYQVVPNMSDAQKHFGTELPAPTPPTPVVVFPDTSTNNAVILERLKAIGVTSDNRSFYSYYSTLGYNNSYNTCGSVAAAMIINQMPFPSGVTAVNITAQDTFLQLIYVLSVKQHPGETYQNSSYTHITSYAYVPTLDKNNIFPTSAVINSSERTDPGDSQSVQAIRDEVERFQVQNLSTSALSPSDTSSQAYGDLVRLDLQSNEPMIALVFINIKTWNGAIFTGGVGHFVVIKGMSGEPLASDRWVKILNPFNNRYEYYKWSDFYGVLQSESFNIFTVHSPYIP